MSASDRPDLDSGYGRRRRSGPPADEDRDPIEAPRPPADTTPTGPPSTSAPSIDGTMSERQMRTLTRQLGLQISLAHHQMLDALVAQRQPPINKKRYVVESAIEALYQQETGGNP